MPVPANVFSLQIQAEPDGSPGDIIMNAGYAASPILVGTPEEQQEQVRKIESVTVLHVGRLLITRMQAEELLRALSSTLETWDSSGSASPGGSS